MTEGATTTESHSKGGPHDKEQPVSTCGLLVVPGVDLAGGASPAPVELSDDAALLTP